MRLNSVLIMILNSDLIIIINFDIVKKSGTWLMLPNEKKIQGKVNLAKHLEDNPEEYTEFENNIFSLVGIER